METKLREFMIYTLQALRLIMDHIELGSVQAENEWVELERSIIRLSDKLKEGNKQGGKDGHQDGP